MSLSFFITSGPQQLVLLHVLQGLPDEWQKAIAAS
jgi:hypothetical protein